MHFWPISSGAIRARPCETWADGGRVGESVACTHDSGTPRRWRLWWRGSEQWWRRWKLSPHPPRRVFSVSRLEAAPDTLVRGVRQVSSAPRAPSTPTARSTPDAAPAAPGAPRAPGSPMAPGMAGAPCAQVRKARNGPTRHEANAPRMTGQVMARTLSRPRKPPRPIHQGLAKSLHVNGSTLLFQRQKRSTTI